MNPPPIPPHSDMFSMGATGIPPPPHRGGSSTPDRMYSQSFTRTPSGRREPPAIPPHSSDATDWDAREEVRRRELEEVQARTAQMEKTMRWWSDCTASWREKWSKVRSERNQLRDECRQLRARLDSSAKESAVLRRTQTELTEQMQELRSELDLARASKNVVDCGGDNMSSKECRIPGVDSVPLTTSDNTIVGGAKDENGVRSNGSIEEKIVDTKSNDVSSRQVKESSVTLDSRLDEALKLVDSEKREKLEMQKTLEGLQIDLSLLTTQLEDMTRLKHDAVQEMVKLKQWKKDRMEQMTSDLEDESVSGSDLDRKLADLRKELEKLQAENAQEWASREKLETEKLALERENKKLKAEVLHMEDELNRRSRQANVVVDNDVKSVQEELSDKLKELSELRHAHSKLKKTLQDKSAELEHARSRAEQYELEVKKLRCRIEELKRDLATAEDESDQQSGQVRKLQRTNDELAQQVEGLSLQVQHMHSRLRRSTPSLNGSRTNLDGCTGQPDDIGAGGNDCSVSVGAGGGSHPASEEEGDAA